MPLETYFLNATMRDKYESEQKIKFYQVRQSCFGRARKQA